MKKIVLTDNLPHSSSNDTIIIDSRQMLQFLGDEDLLFSALVEFMNNLPSQIVNGRSVKEWFRLRNHSLWWFAHVSLWPRIDEYIRFVVAFEKILEVMRPDVIEMQGFYDKADLIRQICHKKNVKLSEGFSSRSNILLKSIRNRGITRGSDLVAKQKRARRIEIAREAKHEDIDRIRKGCVIYVAHETYRRRIYDFETGEVREGEYIAEKILHQIKRKGIDVLGIDVDHTSKGEFQALIQRLNDKDQYWLPFEILEKSDDEMSETVDDIKRRLVELFKNKDFQAMFNFKGIDLWRTLSVRFDLLAERLPQRVRDIETAKNILLKLEPRSVFLLYERGPSAMTFIIAADELGMRTIGMQHGMIHKWHPDYAIGDPRTERSILGAPIPTITIVFGEFYKKLLTERFAYPVDRVLVAGNPTYEYADFYLRQADKETILAQLGLNPTKKIVLMASSMAQKMYGKPEYDVFTIETLVKSFVNHKDIQVVIKLHPKEDGAIYKRIIGKNNASNFSIIDHPIEQLILVCDVFIAVATTTILEAIVLERPVIIIQAGEKIHRDIFSLVENGAAVGAEYNELSNKVLELLNNNALAEKLKTKGAQFARQHFNLPNKKINLMISEILGDTSKNT